MFPRFLLGCLSGALLSALRMPTGLTLMSVPAVSAPLVYGVRALALASVAVALLFTPRLFARGRANGDLLLGVLTGFALHAALLQQLLGIGHLSVLFGLAALVPVVALLLGRGAGTPPSEETRSSLPFALPLALGGAGAALALEGLARHVRLIGAGLALDDSVFGITLLLVLTVGGIGFGRFLRSLKHDRAHGRTAVISLALGAACAIPGLIVVFGYSSPGGLDRHLRRFGLDTSLHGTWLYDVLVSAPAFILPAFGVGTALYAARRRGELVALVLGGAAGTLAVPFLIDWSSSSPMEAVVKFSAGGTAQSAALVYHGVVLAGTGALLSVLLVPGRITARLAGLPAVALCAAAVWFVPSRAIQFVSPWEVQVIVPDVILDTREGLLTVEPARATRVATLDRRRLTPGIDAQAAETRRFEQSLALLPDEVRARGVRVLLVGQFSARRWHELEALGVTRVDRTGAWHAHMAQLEKALDVSDDVPGSILSPGAAREQISASAYDLVLVPPIQGETPQVPNLSGPQGMLMVVWFDAGNFTARRRFPHPLVLAGGQFDHFAVAHVAGTALNTQPEPNRPACLDAGPGLRAPWIWQRLRERKFVRRQRSLVAFARRLALANSGNRWSDLTEGLLEHYEAQVHSSPFETAGQKVELSQRALMKLHLFAMSAEPDAFTRETWNTLALVFVDKRSIEPIFEYLEPLAEAWPIWHELELALAYGDLESLDPEAAAARLGPLVRDDPRPESLDLLARALAQAGRHADAADALRVLLQARPRDAALERRFAIELARAGDPEGKPRIEALLLLNPEDEELSSLLQDGPQPEEGGFEPLGGGLDDD